MIQDQPPARPAQTRAQGHLQEPKQGRAGPRKRDAGSGIGGTGSTGFGSSANGTSSGPVLGGGPIVGVGIPNPKASLLIYKKQKHYNEWEFVYNPLEDQMQAGGIFGGSTQNVNGTGTGTGTGAGTGRESVRPRARAAVEDLGLTREAAVPDSAALRARLHPLRPNPATAAAIKMAPRTGPFLNRLVRRLRR